MAVHLEVDVICPSRRVRKLEARGVTIPGTLGYLTILPDHAALVTEINVGKLEIDAEGDQLEFFVSGGYAEIDENSLKILADVIESKDDIDKGRAESSKKRAIGRLDSKDSSVDIDRAQKSLIRAEARLAFTLS